MLATTDRFRCTVRRMISPQPQQRLPASASTARRIAGVFGGTLLLFILPAFSLAAGSATPNPPAVGNSIVKITATLRPPDLLHPWKAKPLVIKMEGVGTVISEGRILTNAHLVQYATRVMIQGLDSPLQFDAHPQHTAPEIDLAILSVDDPRFLAGHPPCPIAHDFPRVGDEAVIYSIADGELRPAPIPAQIKKIQFERIYESSDWLNYQVAAEIAPGTSGAPLLLNGKIIGVIRSRLPPDTALAVSNKEIDKFLEDIKDGQYDGKATMLDEASTITRKPLRDYLRLPETVHGVLISRPFSPKSALHSWDVITHVNGVAIDDEGFGEAAPGIRLRLGFFAQFQSLNGKVEYEIFREGRSFHVDDTLPVGRERVIPFLRHNYPPYFIFGPIALSIASQEFIDQLEHPEGETKVSHAALIRRDDPLTTRREDGPRFAGEQLVIVPAKLFEHALSEGCFDPQGRVLQSINGIPVRNLRHAVELLRDNPHRHIVFEFAGRFSAPIVLPTDACNAATESILAANKIQAQGSPELLALWKQERRPQAGTQ